jgi:hypothetical protein
VEITEIETRLRLLEERRGDNGKPT